jgi:AhpD family alkylhydroperoxidase
MRRRKPYSRKKEKILMDKKTQEMIAIGASYALNCRPCMKYHKTMAAEAGLTEEEILAAIRVAEAVREGANRKNKEFTENLYGSIKEARCCPAGSACCP